MPPFAQFRFALMVSAALSISACSTVTGPDQADSLASSDVSDALPTAASPSPAIFVPPVSVAASIASISVAPIVVSSAPSDILFGSREIAFSPNLSAFGRWQDVNTRFAAQRGAAKSSCNGSDPKTCPGQWWQNFIAQLENLPMKERVVRVNDTFNRVTYVTATKNWGNPGYWETPFEFLARGGQCQDYAIAKYMALLESGVPEDQMRFVVLRDIPRGVDHAVTVVNVDGEDMVLDNLAAEVRPANQDADYAPYYALNDRGWWLYAPQLNDRNSAVQLAAAPQKAN